MRTGATEAAVEDGGMGEMLGNDSCNKKYPLYTRITNSMANPVNMKKVNTTNKQDDSQDHCGDLGVLAHSSNPSLWRSLCSRLTRAITFSLKNPNQQTNLQ